MPTPSPLVTIAIPTFNRRDALLRTIDALRPQITEKFCVIILDNHSDCPVSEYVEGSEQIRIIRNAVNIGGNPNIMRCFEVCQTEWLWVIGDDDLPAPDALNNILAEINETPEACGINFLGTSKFSPKARTKRMARTALEFLGYSENFSHMLWLPTNVYRMSILRQYTRIAYIYSYSFSMQFVMQLLAARAGLPVLFSPRHVMIHCEPTQAQQWHYAGAVTGMTTLLEMPLSSLERKKLAALLIPVAPLTQEALALLYSNADTIADTRFLFVARWSRLIYSSRNFKTGLMVALIFCASFVRPLTRPLIGLLYRAMRGKTFQQSQIDRYHRV